MSGIITNITIVLPEDSDASKRRARVPGETIHGYVEVITNAEVKFEVGVVFEGHIWTMTSSLRQLMDAPSIQTAEMRIFKVTQTLCTTASSYTPLNQNLSYKLPFDFVIPNRLVAPLCNIPTQYLDLPFTMSQGSVQMGGAEIRGRFEQPSVTYSLSVNSCVCNTRVHLKAEYWPWREIIIMPPSFPAPPLMISAYPEEYRTSSAQWLKKHYLGKTLSQVRASAEEPSPLDLSTTASRATTIAHVALEVGSSSESNIAMVDKKNWTVCVKSFLRSRTFYTTKLLESVPNLYDLGKNPLLQLSTGVSDGETREISGLRWYSVSAAAGRPQWRSDLRIPISYFKNLLPTFLNPLSARRYSLVLQIEILGFKHSPVILEVPIQVVKTSSEFQTVPSYTLPGQVDGIPEIHHINAGLSDIAPPQYVDIF